MGRTLLDGHPSTQRVKKQTKNVDFCFSKKETNFHASTNYTNTRLFLMERNVKIPFLENLYLNQLFFFCSLFTILQMNELNLGLNLMTAD